MCGEIKRRFDQKDLKLVAKVECLLLDSVNGSATMQSSIIPKPILTMYCRRDLDKKSLSLQLRMLQDIISQYNANSGSVIKKVTSVRMLCEVLNFCKGSKQLLSQVHILLQLFLTVPVTTATAERTFSALWRMKTFM